MESYTIYQYHQSYHESNIHYNNLPFLQLMHQILPLNLQLELLKLFLHLLKIQILFEVNLQLHLHLLKLLSKLFQIHTNSHHYYKEEKYFILCNKNILIEELHLSLHRINFLDYMYHLIILIQFQQKLILHLIHQRNKERLLLLYLNFLNYFQNIIRAQSQLKLH